MKEEMASQTLSWRWPMGVVEVEDRKKGRRGRVEMGGTLSQARMMGRREEGDMAMKRKRMTVGKEREERRKGRKDEESSTFVPSEPLSSTTTV